LLVGTTILSERAATDTVEMFEQVKKHFVEPMLGEGFNITRVANDVWQTNNRAPVIGILGVM